MESDLIKTVAPCWVWVIELTATQKADLDTDDYFYFSTKSFKLYNASNTTYYQAHGNLKNIPSIQQNVDIYHFDPFLSPPSVGNACDILHGNFRSGDFDIYGHSSAYSCSPKAIPINKFFLFNGCTLFHPCRISDE